MKTVSLSGRTALITGASSGIGTAAAHALAREGVDLTLAARREEQLDTIAAEVESEHGVETLVVPTDVRDEDAVESMVDKATDQFDGLDILLNNAGLGRGGEVESLSTEDYRLMQETNVDGMFFATRAALPHLKESRGNLLFIGSFAGQYPRPSNPVYAATKWWTRGFAHSVEASVGDDGVAVTVINPTEVRTEFGSASGESFEERFEENEVSEPEEIAEAVVFAAGQRNSTVSELDLYRRDKFAHF
ncbi:MAG: SDR family oxidoreductase [Euryarchaeota archaeon]|nr:SDR family oxidoreductase [Euryarchaeota archaeon]